MLEDFLGPVIIIFICIGLPVVLGMRACYLLIKGRHAERMAMIESGMSLNAFRQSDRRPSRYAMLRNGIVFTGLSAGLFLGVWLQPLMPTLSGGENAMCYELNLSLPIMTLLCAGISFIVYFFLSRRLDQKEREEENRLG